MDKEGDMEGGFNSSIRYKWCLRQVASGDFPLLASACSLSLVAACQFLILSTRLTPQGKGCSIALRAVGEMAVREPTCFW